MRALLDVNVLIALLDVDHVGHSAATAWLAENLKFGWASCPITENGAVRIMATPGYPNPVPIHEVIQRLAQATGGGYHEFWADAISVTNAKVFKAAELLGPKQITDRYLLALAVRNNGRFVTFDQAMRSTGVVGATKKHLVQLAL